MVPNMLSIPDAALSIGVVSRPTSLRALAVESIMWGTQREQLFAAMDRSGSGRVAQFDYVEFIRRHKPKHGRCAPATGISDGITI